jgi:hypothetical protein
VLALFAWIVAHQAPAATLPPAGPAPASDVQQPSTPTFEAPPPAADPEGPATDSPMCDPGAIDYAMPTPFCWHSADEQLDEGH